jgi:hypothetical protein
VATDGGEPVRLLLLLGVISLLYLIPTQQAVVNSQSALEEIRSGFYIARTVSIQPEKRDAYVSCLKQRELPVWHKMKGQDLITYLSVFEETELFASEPNTPAWNFLLLAHTPSSDAASKSAKLEGLITNSEVCEEQSNGGVRRIEILTPTVHSNYPRATIEDDRLAIESKIVYTVEYIAVNDTPADRADYRQRMEQSIGPSIQVLIPKKLDFSFSGMETLKVLYSQPGMPNWNQIHIDGTYLDIDRTPEDLDAALREVNPKSGGYPQVFATLKLIRKKVRNIEARQLFDLAIR